MASKETSRKLIMEKKHWGYSFRQGLFELERRNMGTITKAMGVNLNEF